jgi:hypothetical protein
MIDEGKLGPEGSEVNDCIDWLKSLSNMLDLLLNLYEFVLLLL